MDWDEHNAATDLEWYFQAAAAACGVRSTFAGFEAQMNARAKCGPAGEGQIHPRETRGGAPDAEPLDRLLEYERASRIYARLVAMSAAGRRVLELQFGSERRAGEISLSLACVQPLAVEGHRLARAELRKRQERQRTDAEKRAAIGHQQRARSKPKPKKGHVPTTTTPRDWLLFLCMQPNCHDAVEEILGQARRALQVALREYDSVSASLAAKVPV